MKHLNKLIAGTLLLSFVGGTAYGLTQQKEKLPPNLHKVETKTETVTYYIYKVRKDGTEVEFPIVKVGDYYYGLKMKLVNGLFKRVEPKTRLVPVDASFLKDAEKKLSGYSFTIKGSGKGKLYVVFDSLCPFCMRLVQSGKVDEKLNEFKKKYAEVVFLPLVVHGDASIQGLACIYDKSKKEGIEKAIKEVFSWKKGKSWEEYVNKLNSCKVSPKTKEKIKEVSKLLVKNGVYATPTFFYFNGKNYYKSVGIPNFKGVEK